MFVNMAIHRPRGGKEDALLASMRVFGEVQARQRGLVLVHAFRDDLTGAIIGLSLWDSREAFQAARSDLARALEGVDFDDLLEAPVETFRGDAVV